MPASRGALNVVLDGVIYQRGQILTWQRAKKYAMLEEYNIRTVVNFWPKIDPDMAEAPVDNYLLLFAPRSEQMLDPRMEAAAVLVAGLTEEAPALVLCEAGVTRSVYFCVLVLSKILSISPKEALGRLEASGLSASGLKGFMLRRIEELSVGEAPNRVPTGRTAPRRVIYRPVKDRPS
jgi:hypothetical protein